MHMQPITPQECSRIAQDLQIRKIQVESVVQLLDEGNTVPFITRYRKERTGGLNEDVIRQIQVRIGFLRQLHDRKQTILKTIANQGKLTDELRNAIVSADTTKRLEDLYLPYKPKKKSLAAAAREKGLEPLALAIWHSDPAAGNLEETFPSLVNPERGLNSADDVNVGVGHILAEMMADSAEIRAPIRGLLWEAGQILSIKSEKLHEGQGNEFKNYFQFKESVRQIPPHRILALNRGEKEHALKISFEWPRERISEVALRFLSELMLKKAGQMPLIPAVPPAPVARPEPAPASEAPPPAEVPTTPEQPVVEATPAPEQPTAPASPEAASQAHLVETPIAETPVAAPADAPPAELAPSAAPLVASLPTDVQPVLTGEPLSPGSEFKSPHATYLRAVLEDALSRLLIPSLEREIRNELTEEAEHHAVQVFARNLRSLLLQPPLRGKRVLAIDPGFRTGCKLAALDEIGNLLEHGVMYPFTPPKKKDRGKKESPPSASSPATGTPVAAELPAGAPTTECVLSSAGSIQEETPAAVPVADTPPSLEVPPPPFETATALPPEPLPSAEPSATPEPSSIPAPAAETTASAESPSPETAAAPEAPGAAETLPPAAPEPPPPDPKIEAKARLVAMAKKYELKVIAIGNGTGCRETEEIVSEAIATDLPDVAYVIVNEAGASVYSASPVGREEFPNLDATTRGTISIGRRLQDPLSELVKVDPQSIGVGLYQHDMGRKELKESLDAVVESAVNQVGVDLNTASVPLLRHVAGMNQLVARELVEHRTKSGPFKSREELLQVPTLGPARFTQAAGFLKIPDAANPFDRTWIHPESYELATKILGELGYEPAILDDQEKHTEFDSRLRELPIEDTAKKLNAGAPTVYDIIGSLLKPGRDPREDLPPPIFKKGILKLEDLQPGMQLLGTVLNVVDFGAFVDVGLKDSGLVHISQMANRYIKSPYDVVAVNDVVKVWVKTIDAATRHVSLTMIEPGTEQKPAERGPRGPREGSRPPRGRRPGPPPGQQQGTSPGEGQRDERRGPPRHGGRPGGPPRGPRPEGQRPAAERQPPPPPPPPPPPRKPRREPPKPKLTKEALEGKVALRTFSELSAFFGAKKEPEAKPVQPAFEPPMPPPEASTVMQPHEVPPPQSGDGEKPS
jgi:uncharacterized protein